MAEKDEARLVVQFDDTGETDDTAIEFKIQSAFMIPADAWSATFATEGDPAALRRKFVVGRPVSLFIGDRLQLIGRIGTTSGTESGSGALRVSGRDYMADLLDPDVDRSVRINGGMTLADALLEGLGVFGITEIETDLEAVTSKKMGKVNYKVVEDFEIINFDGPDIDTGAIAEVVDVKRTIAEAEPVPELKPNKGGEAAYSWAARVAARSGFTIQPGSKRSAISVVAPDYSSPTRYRLIRPGNIMTGVATRNGDDIPSFVNMSGRFVDEKQQAKGGWEGFSIAGEDSPTALRSTAEGRRFIEASGMVDRRLKKGEKNAPPALYKPIYNVDDKAKTNDQLLRSTRRMLAEKTSRFFTYRATVLGHTDAFSGATYATNTLAEVSDGVEDVNEQLWIAETELAFNSQGKTTTLDMLLPGAYLL